MTTPIYLFVALIYGAAAVFVSRQARLPVVAGMQTNADSDNSNWMKWAVLAGIVLHGMVLERVMFSEEGINLGLGNAVSLIVWLTVLIYWLGSWVYPIASLQMYILPVAAVGILVTMLLPSQRLLSLAGRPALAAHLIMSLLAYSLFTIATLHALLTSALDRGLRRGTLPLALRGAPPLIAMESLLLRIIQVGFILLTLALASGFLFSGQVFGKAITFPHNAHKVVFGVLSWAIFGAFLVGHRFYGWRGRTAAMLTLVGFGLLLISYVGSKFVLEVILKRVVSS